MKIKKMHKKIFEDKCKYYLIECKGFLLIFIFLLLFVFPFLFAFMIRHCTILGVFNADALLVFWGTAITVSIDIITKFISRLHEQNLKYETVPKIYIDVKKHLENANCFVMNIYSATAEEYRNLCVEGEEICAVLKNDTVVYLYPIDCEPEHEDWVAVNIDNEDGYPKYITLHVCDKNDLCWCLEYKKVKSYRKVNYVFDCAYII